LIRRIDFAKKFAKKILITNRKELCTTNSYSGTKDDDVAKIGRIGISTIGIKKGGNWPDMDEGTIKTPNPNCRLYWCLIEFIDWRHSQSWWYFRPLL
jgi:hypothetical protein